MELGGLRSMEGAALSKTKKSCMHIGSITGATLAVLAQSCVLEKEKNLVKKILSRVFQVFMKLVLINRDKILTLSLFLYRFSVINMFLFKFKISFLILLNHTCYTTSINL